MLALTVADALVLHCLAVTVVLLAAYYMLRRFDQGGLLNAGSWVCLATLGYFVLNPLVALATGYDDLYERALRRTEGPNRVLWIALTICVGLIAFFFAHTIFKKRSGHAPPRSNDGEQFRIADWIVIIVFLSVGIYTTLANRINMDFGRHGTHAFAADITAYQYKANQLALYPIALLFSMRRYRPIGWAALGAYLLVRLFDPWDRASLVYPLLAIAFIYWVPRASRSTESPPDTAAMTRRAPWKFVLLIIGAAALGLFLFKRGHVAIGEDSKHTPYNDRDFITSFFTSNDIAMLPALELNSYQYDRVGYNYGTPLLAQLSFGALPRKYFPNKDELARPFIIERDYDRIAGENLLPSNRKSTVIGSLYSYGGIIGVVIGMFFLGWLSPGLDRLVRAPACHTRALGAVWLSMLWMVFASAIYWGVITFLISGVPFFAHWVLLRATAVRNSAHSTKFRGC